MKNYLILLIQVLFVGEGLQNSQEQVHSTETQYWLPRQGEAETRVTLDKFIICLQ